MRSTQVCPKCSRKKFLVQPQFHHPQYANGAKPLPAATVPVPGQPEREWGSFEAWTCLKCGYTEFYARGLPKNVEEAVEQWTEEHPGLLRIVDAEPRRQGPYR